MAVEHNHSRREFLGKALGAVAFAALNPLAIFLSPKDVLASGTGFIIDLNSQKYSQLNSVDGSYRIVIAKTKETLANGDILPYSFIVTRTTPSAFSVLLGWCTHRNSDLGAYDSSAKLIACQNTDPGHGSTFDVNGIILDGPAHANLTQYNYTYHPVNNTLEVFIPGLGVNDGAAVINSLSLFQNFPNPVKTVTTIPLKILYYSKVTLKVTDALGNIIAVLHDGGLEAGDYKFEFDASIFPSGTYFYTLTGSGQNLTKQMIVIK